MKHTIVLFGILIALGVATHLKLSESEVILNERTATTTEAVVEEDTIDPEWEKEAQKAYEEVIRRKELEAQKNLLEGQIEALENELEVVDKELGVY